MKKISFQTSFEGGKRRAMTESKRERIPDLYSRKKEGPPTMLFSFDIAKKDVLVPRRTSCDTLKSRNRLGYVKSLNPQRPNHPSSRVTELGVETYLLHL